MFRFKILRDYKDRFIEFMWMILVLIVQIMYFESDLLSNMVLIILTREIGDGADFILLFESIFEH